MTETLRTWRLDLPRLKPLNANERLHWAPEAKRKKALREAAHWMAKAQRIPPLGRCEVELTYCPPDSRRRDADNLAPTLKAACDGLVDAGIVPDDTPDLMRKLMPVIGEVQRPALLYVTVRELEVS